MASPTPSAHGRITSRPGVMVHVIKSNQNVSMWLYFSDKQDRQQATIVAEYIVAVRGYYEYGNFVTFAVPIVDLQACLAVLHQNNPAVHFIFLNSRDMEDIVFTARTRAGLPAVDPATPSHMQSPPPSGGIIAPVLRSPSNLYQYLTGGQIQQILFSARKLASLPEDAAATDSQPQTGTDNGLCICTG